MENIEQTENIQFELSPSDKIVEQEIEPSPDDTLVYLQQKVIDLESRIYKIESQSNYKRKPEYRDKMSKIMKKRYEDQQNEKTQLKKRLADLEKENVRYKAGAIPDTGTSNSHLMFI